MKVTIHGPNLDDQSKGQFHVHAADCGDNKKYSSARLDPSWTIEVETQQEAVLAVYDFVEEDESWEDYNDLWFAPCLNLPRE